MNEKKSAKLLHRLNYIIKLFTASFFKWKISDWAGFWLMGNDKVRINSLRFIVRRNLTKKISDLSMLFEVIIFKQYKMCRIHPDDIIIDIGAHIGGYTILASHSAPAGKVYSFEPLNDSFRILEKNVMLNKKNNIKIFKQGVGKENKKTFFYVNELNLAESSLYKATPKKIKVEITTLPKIFKDNKIKRCNILKLDCEGAEYDILFSSKKMLDKIDRIILEYHKPEYFGLPREYSAEKLARYLKDNKFSVKLKRSNYYQGIMYAERNREICK